MRRDWHKDASLVIAHIKDWREGAKIGQRRVIFKSPLSDFESEVLNHVRRLGIVYQRGEKYLLEKAF